jgi:hypothetical protein
MAAVATKLAPVLAAAAPAPASALHRICYLDHFAQQTDPGSIDGLANGTMSSFA